MWMNWKNKRMRSHTVILIQSISMHYARRAIAFLAVPNPKLPASFMAAHSEMHAPSQKQEHDAVRDNIHAKAREHHH